MPSLPFPPPLPTDRPYDVVGLGGNASDHIAIVPRHPLPGEKVRFLSYSHQGGGRTATAMVAVARLGWRPRYLGCVGDDADGRWIVDGLEAEGVDVAGVRTRSGGLTQRALILVDERTGERTIVWGRSDGMPLEPDEIDGEVDAIVTSARLFYTDAQDPRSAARAARIARRAGLPVLADIEDIRPGLDQILPLVDFLIVSASFPEAATGSRDPSEAVRFLEERTGGALVVITRGARGCVARIDGALASLPAYAVEVRDTTGAGDVFHAAFAVACLRGLALRDALDFANAVAAMKCRRPGGRDGIPHGVEEVERFRRETPHLELTD